MSPPSRRWRLLNLDTVTYGWVVGELRLFSDTACSQELTGAGSSTTWQATASGDYSAPPERAYDGATWTEWKAQCYLCSPREAWLGVSFSQPVMVKCLKLWQWGRQGYRSGQVLLERWEDSTAVWEPVLSGSGLDGGRWDTLRFVRCAALEVPDHGKIEVSNQGYYPSEATFECSGVRILGGYDRLQCLPDGSWEGDPPTCWALMQLLVLIVVVVATDIALFFAYYFFCIRRKPPRLHHRSYIPDENMGTWSHDMIADLRDDPDCVSLQLCCCPFCRVADTWRGMGQFPYYLGAPMAQLLLPLLPCMGAFFRGSIRHRLGIKGKRLADLTVWLCCIPCAALQEAKTCDTVCMICEEEAEAMRHDAEKKQETLDAHHKAAYEHSHLDAQPSKVGRAEDGFALSKGEQRPSGSGQVERIESNLSPGPPGTSNVERTTVNGRATTVSSAPGAEPTNGRASTAVGIRPSVAGNARPSVAATPGAGRHASPPVAGAKPSLRPQKSRLELIKMHSHSILDQEYEPAV